MSIQAFTITLAQSILDDLHERLALTRWPDEVEGAGWDYGTNVAYLKELVDYWQHTFDWPTGCATRWLFGVNRLLKDCRSPHAPKGGGSWLSC